MKSPADMKIIQIDITNACTKKCSNCTRFCGNHRKPFMMDFETFKRAVDSMEGFPGIVGIMGGEPTLHPQFEEFVTYFASRFGKPGVLDNARQPVSNFNAHIVGNVFDIDCSNQRGLWSILGRRYYENYELIQETFGYQVVNDHSTPCDHAALLMTRKELGVPDDEWLKMRDACWIQNRWSASIHPKGAFFCEVAAALDATFDGPGGWPIEPGWWQRKPEDFGDQLQWCEMCSACLDVPTRNANEEIDDVSPVMYEKLVQIRSPKLKQKLINIVPVGDAGAAHDKVGGRAVDTNTPYLPDADHSLRVAPTNRTIYPRRFDAIVLDGGAAEPLRSFIAARARFDDAVSLAPSFSAQARVQCDAAAIRMIEAPVFGADALNSALAGVAFSDWCVVIAPGFVVEDALLARLRDVVLNPGSLYFLPGDGDVPSLVMFNALARSLRGHLPAPFGAGGVAELMRLWPANKRVALDPEFDRAMATPPLDAIDRVFEKIRSDYSWIAAALPQPVGARVMRLGAWAHSATRRAHGYIQRTTSGPS